MNLSDRQLQMFRDSTEDHRLDIIAGQIKRVRACYTKRCKASESALTNSCARKGIRGGRNTTLNAKLAQACEAYDKEVSVLKEYIKALW